MIYSAARGLSIAALMSCFNCGPVAPTSLSPPPPLAIGPAAPAQPPALAKPEPPPRAPEDLALLVRVGDPEQLAREVVSILPPSAASVAASLDPTQLLVLLLGPRLAAVVDTSQSIDIASIGKDASFVVSMAVKQEPEEKLTKGLVLREEGGLVHIAKPDEPQDSGRMSACAFTAGAGRALTRLVCASDDAALASTADYLARTVAIEPLDADARLTLPGRLLRERTDHTARAMSDAASAKLGGALVERFLEEVDRIDADLRFAGPRVEITLNLRLTKRESMLSRLFILRSKPAPPPQAFYRLPADSLVALHTTGALGEDVAPLRKTLGESIELTLAQDGYQTEKTHALRQRLETMLLTGGPLVLGTGVVGGREGADKALAALENAHGKADEARAESQARGALLPWMMVEVDEPADRWTQGLRDLVRRAADADKTRSPGSTSRSPRDPDGDHVDLRIGAVDPALKLPPGTLHLEVLIAPRTKGKRPTRRAHIFVVPKGTSTWLGYCEDATAIAARLRLAIDDATEVGTLAKSPDALLLRARPAQAAGIVALGGVAHLLRGTTTLADLRSAARVWSRGSAVGLRGTEIVTWTASADATPGSIHATARAEATRQTVADVLRSLGL